MTTPIPFGKYQLLERIDAGGMAEVFRAIAPGAEGFERFVAIKRILPHVAAKENFTRMFIDEAKIAGQLSHPNIAQIFDLGSVDGSYFIAMELVHGKDLKAVFSRLQGRETLMPVEAVCHVFLQLFDGLAYAHDKCDPLGRPLNLVHQDISPQNILVSYDGETKLIDFGLAEAAGIASQAEEGIVKGKFAYLSPEQVDGKTIDHRSDLFSAGICMYEMLTARRLFRADTDVGTVQSVARCQVTAPSEYRGDVPPELDRIVLKLLARNRADRYQGALEVYEDLLRFMDAKSYAFGRKQMAAYMRQLFKNDLEAAQRGGFSVPPGAIQTAPLLDGHIPQLASPDPWMAPAGALDPAALAAAKARGHSAMGVQWEDEEDVPTHVYLAPDALGDASETHQRAHRMAATDVRGERAEPTMRFALSEATAGPSHGLTGWLRGATAGRRQPIALVIAALIALTTLLLSARALFAHAPGPFGSVEHTERR